MKNVFKFIVCALMLVCLVLGVTACEMPNEQPSKQIDFNKLLSANYNTLKVELKTTHEIGVLTNVYDVSNVDNGTKVVYSCQSFEQLSLENASQERIKTVSGSVIYKDGKVVEQSGEQVLFALPQSTKPNLDISVANMTDVVVLQQGTITGKVVDGAKLFKQAVDFSDITITFSYTDSAITSIIIEYVKQDVPVTITLTLA